MHGADEFLRALAIVLCVAAVTTVVFRKLHQPVVLGYILAGLIIGPHVPIPVVASPDIVHKLSELGVILLMFGLGLDFSLRKLFRAAPTAGLTGILQCSVMVWLGYVTGTLLGWTPLESIFVGAIIAISSTTIIAKAFDEQGIQGPLREFVVAVLIVEDLIAVLLMAVLTGVSTGSGLSAFELARTVGRLVGFLVALVAIGLLVVPRVMRAIVKLDRGETTIVAAIAICFGVSFLAQALGYSVALGAFVAGMLVAESGEAKVIEPLVRPVRDVFGAVFFVSVGMLIDPATMASNWVAILVLTIVVVVGKLVSVALGAFLTGNGTRTSIAAGMSMSQIGEFSFIIAGLGVTLGALGPQIYPVAVAVSAITTLLTPWLIRGSTGFGSLVDAKLPKRMQTFVALYAGWIARLRNPRGESRSHVRRLARTLLLDVVVVAGVVIGVSLSFAWLTDWLETTFGLGHAVARLLVVIAGGAAALPFCLSILWVTRQIAKTLGDVALPRAAEGAVDLGKAPRSVLEVTVQLGGLLIAGLPLVALTQPFLHGYTGAIVLLVALTALGVVFWRTASELHGHVRSVSKVFVRALAAQAASGARGQPAVDKLAEARDLLPGVGEPVRIQIPADARAVGRSLADLELRGTTGATVLAIIRAGEGELPDAHDPLLAGDILAVAGIQDAINAATDLLTARK
jgi:CPA2 family monovalent cation:H+ antiporter-2